MLLTILCDVAFLDASLLAQDAGAEVVVEGFQDGLPAFFIHVLYCCVANGFSQENRYFSFGLSSFKVPCCAAVSKMKALAAMCAKCFNPLSVSSS